eukprot:TRINITY_DN825_c0_g1_i5.p1 TRINITY_DN825_c0_g1~~TRINITY_DN825_c0_g1_i5.p1  ORF type:complete len:156 (-),score=29.69 TRINITY_DN825_c0_g1_i5:164-631(-)
MMGVRRDGMPYSQECVDNVWNMIKTLNRNPKIAEMFNDPFLDRSPDNEELFNTLFGSPVCTLSGRVRENVRFTQGRNTPFSGLAADGAKLALWNLTMIGYRVVGFIHDEIVIELPETCNLEKEKEIIEKVVCESMQVMTGNIPIACTTHISKTWG